MINRSDRHRVLEQALAGYLHMRWPFRHTRNYVVCTHIVDDEKHVHAAGGLGKVQRGEAPFCVSEIAISTAALTAVGVGGLVVDHRVILHVAQTAHGYRAVWVEQARRYALKVVRGYNVCGHFVVADSEPSACAIAHAHEPQPAA